MKPIIILFTLVIAATTISCEKLYNTTWVCYDDTFCANPWSSIINISVETPQNEKIKAVEKYFKDKGIKTFKIEIVKDKTLLDFYPDSIICLACHCKTGYRVKCKIKERDLSKMKKKVFINKRCINKP